jgi:hypothetical protein
MGKRRVLVKRRGGFRFFGAFIKKTGAMFSEKDMAPAIVNFMVSRRNN